MQERLFTKFLIWKKLRTFFSKYKLFHNFSIMKARNNMKKFARYLKTRFFKKCSKTFLCSLQNVSWFFEKIFCKNITALFPCQGEKRKKTFLKICCFIAWKISLLMILSAIPNLNKLFFWSFWSSYFQKLGFPTIKNKAKISKILIIKKAKKDLLQIEWNKFCISWNAKKLQKIFLWIQIFSWF